MSARVVIGGAFVAATLLGHVAKAQALGTDQIIPGAGRVASTSSGVIR